MAINLTDAMNKLRQALNESQNRYTPAQTNNHVQRSLNTNNITNNSRLQSRPTSKVSATVNPVGTNQARIRKLGSQTNYNNRSTNTHNAVVNRQNSTNTAQNNAANAITRAAQNVAQNVENLRNEASRYGVGGDLTNAGNGQSRVRAGNERTGQNRVLAQRKLANPDYYQHEVDKQGIVTPDDWLTLNNRGEYQDSGILRNREKQKIEKDRQERMENAQIDDLVNSALQVLTPEFLYSYAPNSLRNVNNDNNDFKSRSVNTVMLANIENNQDLRNFVRSQFNVDENTARNLISIAVSNAKEQFNTQQAIDRAINQKEVNNPLDYVASLVQGLSSGANTGFQGLNQGINNLSLLNPFQSNLERRADEERLKAMASLNENLSTPEYENVGGIAGLGQQLAPIIGGQAPQLLVGSVFGPTAGLGTLFASAMGSSTGQALQEGAESDEALLYGLTSGAIETATEKMFDVVGVLGRGVVGDAMSNLAGKIFSGPRGKALLRYLINALGEGAEEVVSEYLDAFARGIYDEDQREKGFMEKINETTPDALQSGLLGALSGGLLGLGSQIAEQRQISRDINAQQAQNAARSSEQARDRANRITQYPNTMQQVQAAQYSTDEQVGQALEELGLRDDMVGIDPENISQIEQVLEDEIIDDIQPELVIELNDEITGDEPNDGALRRTIGLDELHEFDYRLDDPITVENTPLARSVANSTDHSFNGTGQAVSNYFGTEYSDDVKNALYEVRDSLRNDGEVSAESLDGLASTLAQQIVREQRVNNVMFNTIDAIESQPIDTLQLNNFINDPATAQMYPQVIGTVTDTDSLTRLYQLHQEATALKPLWDESQARLVDDITSNLGYRVVGLNDDPNFSYKALGNVIIDPGAKSIGSAVNKVLRSANKIDDFGNVYSLESIKDHNRLSVQVDSVKSLLELLDYFKVNHGASVEVMDGSRPDGYIGFHATWQDENGTRNEIQISPDFDVKQQSEALYQQVRDINKNSATPEQLRMIDQVNAESKALWNQLAKDFGLTPEVMRMASSSDTGRWASRNGRSNGNPEGTHSPVDLLKNSRTFPASANSNAPSSSIKNPFIDSLLSSNRILSRYDVNGVKQAIKNELDGSIGSIELRMLPVIREMNIREYGQQRLNQGQDVAVENETPQGRVSQTVKSVANSNMFTEQTRQNLMDMASRGNFSRDSRNFAQFYSEMEDFVDNYNGNIVNDLLTDDPATNGFSMFGNLDRAQAVLSIVEERLKAQGNYEDAGRLGVVWQKYASQSGQDLNTVQQIYKMFPKKARDKAIIAQTEEIINQANRALGRDNDGNAPKIVLTEQDKADLRNAKNPSQKQKEIATRTLKASRNSSIGAKLQALRYAFMLYNPKTWIRNFLGNEINTGFNNIVVNNINALLDKTIGKGLAKSGGKNYLPTTTFTVEKKYKDLARRILPTEKEINNGAKVLVNLDSGTKYGSTDIDSLAFNSDWGRKIYKTITKPMDLALNTGDKVFFDATFRDRLARFLQANKNTVDFDFAITFEIAMGRPAVASTTHNE